MSLLRRLLDNHVLANSAFVVVLIVGTLQYFQLPRSKDPEINFNWISVITRLPGASPEDIERLVTDPLEEAIQQVSDVKFVTSTSRENVSSILVRFNEISERTFDKRINDLRRELQNKANSDLPADADDPQIMEITTDNSYPTATVLVSGKADDEVLRRVAQGVKDDLERIKGVDTINTAALVDPELLVEFFPERMQAKGIMPTQLADTVSAYFRDTAAGDMKIGNQQWLVRVIGTDSNPGYLANLPLVGSEGQIPIDAVARVSRGRENPEQMVSYDGRPGVLLALTKQGYVNTLDLVQRINNYIEQKNQRIAPVGVQIKLLDDQSAMTSDAIHTMQSNALLGLILVMFVTWLFLGGHIAMFLGLGIPFTLAATFWLLKGVGETLNQSVLLGVVIVLGMLVDDAVVVVEAIYYRIQRGAQAMQAALDSLVEVFSPVTSSVATTMAAFLPLMLLPGILGDFMFVIPFVVTVALAISLLEAYWILPVHIAMVQLNVDRPGRIQQWRTRWTHWLRVKYSLALIRVLRRPNLSLVVAIGMFLLAVLAFVLGMVRIEFFAFDPMRMFYVNVEMAPGTPLEQTLKQVEVVEAKVRKHLLPGEARGLASVSGQMFTASEPFFGDQYGQLTVSLNPLQPGMRGVADIVDDMRDDIMNTVGPAKLSFLIMEGGPPKGKPISVKVRGDNYDEIEAAVVGLRNMLKAMPAVSDISDNDSPGKLELRLKLDADAVRNAGLNPAIVSRSVRLLFDGDVVATMQHEGKKLDVRVRAVPQVRRNIDSVLEQTIALPNGGRIALGQLVKVDRAVGKSSIRHYNFRRAITVEADLDKKQMDTIAANNYLKAQWRKVQARYPNIDLDFSGELDDIYESLNSLGVLALLGIGLIYLILGTQFKSYWQPFMILVTVPLAFTGVTLGLIVSNNPVSLYTLYGVVALTGIAVNSAIVMIHAANQRLEQGMSVLHATLYAARRRVVPIIITSLTTVAGLFSLAIGLGGKSLLWGPVASAIVWGLAFSTVLTLFVIPLLYRAFMRRSRRVHARQAHKPVTHAA